MEEEGGNPNSHSNSHSQGGSARRNMKKNKKHSLPLKMFLSLDGDDMVRPECPNASNPFHKCADYCTLRAPETKSHEGNKGVKKVEARRHVDPNCRYASNPYHSCGPYCYEDDGESSSSYSSSSLHQFKGDKREEVKSRDVDPKCKNASNPFHKCSDYCFRNTSEERKESSKAIAKGKEGVEMKKNVVPNCINASNPFHVCGSYCLPIIPKKGQNKGDVKNEAQSSNCKYASNPFHNCAEFCSTGEKGLVPKKMEKRNVHSHPENVTVKTDEAAELSTGAVKVSEKKQISRNSSTSCSESSKERVQSFYEQELLERFGILRDNEDDLVATEKRGLHLKHIDSFDVNHHFIAHCRQSYHEEEYYPFEKEKIKDDVKMQRHQWIDAHDSDSKISAYWFQRFSENDQSDDGKTVIPPSSSIRFVLLFVSVLYYIAHVIITGGGVVMDKNKSRIKEREDERANCNMYCFDEKNREM